MTRHVVPFALAVAACVPPTEDPGSTTDTSSGGTLPAGSEASETASSSDADDGEPGSSETGSSESASSESASSDSASSDSASGESASSEGASSEGASSESGSSEGAANESSSDDNTATATGPVDPTGDRCNGDGTDTPFCAPCASGGWCHEGEVCVEDCEPAPPGVLCDDADVLGTELPWPHGVTANVSAIAFGNVDGDALADLFFVSDGHLFLVLGAGGSSSIDVTADGPNVMQVGDFDGSGTDDVVVLPGEDFDTLDIVTTLANGELELADSVSSDEIMSAAVGDFDGDGNVDLMASEWFDGWIRFGIGDGTLDDAFVHAIEGAYVTAADFDADGMTDLASSGLDLWYGNATLDFGVDQALHGTYHEGLILDEYYTGIVAARFDGDDVFDLAAGGITSPTFTAYSLGWPGVPAGPPEIVGTPSRSGRVLAADVDGDGHDDLIEIGEEEAGLAIALGRTDVGDSLFSCWTTAAAPFAVPLPGAFMAFGAVAAGDIDGDGDDELALSDGDDVVLLATQ